MMTHPFPFSLPFRPTTTTTFASGGSSEFNKNRAARKPGPMDLVVELQKPLGIVLEEDEKGNVYVKELSPAGNAARVRYFDRKRMILIGNSMRRGGYACSLSLHSPLPPLPPTHNSRARSRKATW